MANLKNTTIDDEIFQIPAGTTGQRPLNPVTGELRFNTDENTWEVYSGSAWNPVQDLSQRTAYFQCLLQSFRVDGSSYSEYSSLGTTNLNFDNLFSAGSSRVTVPYNGVYRAYVHAHYTTTSTRRAAKVSFTLNGSRLSPEGAAVYVRNSGSSNGISHTRTSVNLESLIQCSAGDEIGLVWANKASYGGAQDIQGSNSLFHLEFLGE